MTEKTSENSKNPKKINYVVLDLEEFDAMCKLVKAAVTILKKKEEEEEWRKRGR